MDNAIQNEWMTVRLLITDLHHDDIQAAQNLYAKSAFMQEWTGQELDLQYVHRCVYEGDLPPNGHKNYFRIQAVRNTTDNRIIGLLVLYHGYPHGGCVYITFLFFDSDQRQQGLGQELVQELFSRLKLVGYSEVRANVQLKNWSGLRFWTKVGFTTITGIYGDTDYSRDSYADIELSRQL
ncbi:MAG: GNAT family N-acetyltransferase [Bacilli bacterium]